MKISTELTLLSESEGRRRKHLIVRCAHCDKLFPKIKKEVKRANKIGGRHFCSKACAQASRRTKIKITCSSCQKEIEVRPCRLKEYNFCSQNCKNHAQSHAGGRILLCGPENGKRYRVRAFAEHGEKCEWCGEELKQLLDAHHIDHDRSNSDPSNLLVVCVRCHAAETRKLVEIINRKPMALCEDGKVFVASLPASRSPD